MIFRNLTPHAVSLLGLSGARILDRPEKACRILTASGELLEEYDGIGIYSPAQFERIVNLPEPREGVTFIVSQLSALAVAALHGSRADIVYPATRAMDGAVRDGNGVISVRKLIRAT